MINFESDEPQLTPEEIRSTTRRDLLKTGGALATIFGVRASVNYLSSRHGLRPRIVTAAPQVTAEEAIIPNHIDELTTQLQDGKIIPAYIYRSTTWQSGVWEIRKGLLLQRFGYADQVLGYQMKEDGSVAYDGEGNLLPVVFDVPDFNTLKPTLAGLPVDTLEFGNIQMQADRMRLISTAAHPYDLIPEAVMAAYAIDTPL